MALNRIWGGRFSYNCSLIDKRAGFHIIETQTHYGNGRYHLSFRGDSGHYHFFILARANSLNTMESYSNPRANMKTLARALRGKIKDQYKLFAARSMNPGPVASPAALKRPPGRGSVSLKERQWNQGMFYAVIGGLTAPVAGRRCAAKPWLNFL